MTIKKGNSIYTVTESKGKWNVSKENGSFSFSVDVPKELCRTMDELCNYIQTNDLF